VATEIERLPPRPAHAAGTRLRQRPDDGVWLLERNGRYLQLSPAARAIWALCDGELDWTQIGARYREDFGVDGTAAIHAFAKVLEERGFFTAPDAREAIGVSRAPAATEAYLSWSLETVVEKVYAVTRWAFRPLAVAAFAAVAVAGAIAFVVTPHAVKAHGLGEQAALVLAILVSVAIHEAGHALTLRHFGATVRRAGFGWYWFAPVAFVDTSDAYALPRAKRIAVSLAGPFASLIVAGCAGLFAAFVHVRSAESIAWSLAAFTYIATLWNFNPLLELDGYYVLTDLLQRPNLRRDGFMALSGRRRDSVAFAYALGALAYGATVVFVAIPSLARMTIVALLPATACGFRSLRPSSRSSPWHIPIARSCRKRFGRGVLPSAR
jgi:putative peptide zinc metalloprotease protein